MCVCDMKTINDSKPVARRPNNEGQNRLKIISYHGNVRCACRAAKTYFLSAAISRMQLTHNSSLWTPALRT